jgi:hypothetical protein
MFTTSVRVQYCKVEKVPGIGVLRGWYSMQASKDLGCNADQTPHSKLIAFQADRVILQAIHCTENLIYVFPEMKMRGLVSQFLHSSISAYLDAAKIGRPILRIYKLLTNT